MGKWMEIGPLQLSETAFVYNLLDTQTCT